MMKLELFQPLFCKIKLQYIEICTHLCNLFACSPSVSLSVYNGSPVEFSADLGCRTTGNIEPWVLKIAVLKYYSVSKTGTTAKSNPKQATDPISLHTKFGDNSSNTFPLNERKPCVMPDIGRRKKQK